MNFPEFMFSEKNKIPASQQNTPDIEGYYYTANDGSQMAFWIYKADRVSKEHTHDYDEWMLCAGRKSKSRYAIYPCFRWTESEGITRWREREGITMRKASCVKGIEQ